MRCIVEFEGRFFLNWNKKVAQKVAVIYRWLSARRPYLHRVSNAFAMNEKSLYITDLYMGILCIYIKMLFVGKGDILFVNHYNDH